MAHLQYFNYSGFGEKVKEETHYSQAVRVGDIIEVSGHGGWDPQTRTIPPPIPASIPQQISTTFTNIDLALRTAGATKGWAQVYHVRVYSTRIEDEEAMGCLVENLREWCPGHCPLLTGVEVKGLAFGMKVEVEVEAHVGG